MSDILAKIEVYKRQEIAAAKAALPFNELRSMVDDVDSPRGFVDAIRNDTDPPVTGEDGLRAMEVALCAYESAKRHEPVDCPDAVR